MSGKSFLILTSSRGVTVICKNGEHIVTKRQLNNLVVGVCSWRTSIYTTKTAGIS